MVPQEMGILFTLQTHRGAHHQGFFNNKAVVSSHSTGIQEHLLSLNKPCFYRRKQFHMFTSNSLFLPCDLSASSDVLDFLFSVKHVFAINIQNSCQL